MLTLKFIKLTIVTSVIDEDKILKKTIPLYKCENKIINLKNWLIIISKLRYI